MPGRPGRPVKVFVVEPFPTTSAVICRALEAPGVRVVGRTGEAAQVVARTRALRPDVVVLDGTIGYRSDQRLIAELKASPRAPTVIVLSSHTDQVYREAAAAGGADLVILKTALIRELLPAVRALGGARQPTCAAGARARRSTRPA